MDILHRQKIAKALMGNKNGLGHKKSPEVRRRISKARKNRFKKLGYLNSLETRRKMSKSLQGRIAWNKGKKGFMSEAGKERLRQSVLKRLANPKNHYNWKGGKSFEPYSCQFTKQLKLKIKRRDNFKCRLCGVLEKDYFQKLSIHHIDFDKNNCNEINLVVLCRSCNSKVNYNREYWSKYFKEKVQRLETELPSGKMV